MSTLLALKNVNKIYRRRGGHTVAAMRDVSMELVAEKFTVVRGPSGSGKTTLLLAAGGLLAPDNGDVMVNGTNLYALSAEERAKFRARNIGYVFQQFHLVPYLSVVDNVLVPALAYHEEGLRERAETLVSTFGLAHRRDHPPSELSTGERQRVALARALLHNPRVLLADEPTGNLDDKNAAVVIAHLESFVKQGGAVLVATHDSRMQGDLKFELNDGALQASGDRT